MCRAISHAPANCPCPCAALTRDPSQWCNGCYIVLHELERNISLELPREYTVHDVLVAALREQSIGAYATAPTSAA
jgi:hypothetical protein